MATSGSTRVAIFESWLHLEFSWQQTSQSVENNTTTISWQMKLISGNGTLVRSGRAWSVVIDGTTYSGTVKVDIDANSTQTLASGTAVIPHKDDGTKSFSYTFTQEFKLTLNNGKYMGTYSGAGSATLGAIARASQPSLVTWPETTQNVGNFGAEFSIHMNRKGSTFTHTVRYEYGSRKGTIATNVGTGTTWAVPLDFMNDIPNATSGSGRIYVDTYSGTKLIGTKYTGFTATVPSTVKPVCSLKLTDITEVDKIYGSPVQGLSKIKIEVSTTPAYSSPIESYDVSADGGKYTAQVSTTAELVISGSSKVTATVKDKRGRQSAEASYTMNVQAYSPPTITSLTVHRVDDTGKETDQGDHIKVEFSAVVSPLSNKNTATYTLWYKKSTEGDNDWTLRTLTAYKNVFSVTGGNNLIKADGNSSYDIKLVVEDNHNTATRSTSASTAFTLMNWGANGTSFALGKVAEESNSFEVALDNHFYGVTRQVGNHYSFASIGQAETDGYILMARITVTEVNADSPMTFVFSRRQAVAPMTVHVLFDSVADLEPTLNSIVYEGENYGAMIYQTSGSVWDLYVKKVNKSDTVTLVDWYTSYRQMKRISVTFPGTLVSSVPTPRHIATPAMLRSLLDYIYPVGSVYISYSHVSPATLFGGTWARITNAFLWAVDGNGEIGVTGGAKTHTLTEDELPSHSHGSVYSQHAAGTKSQAWYTTAGSSLAYGAVATGGGKAHNNMPPYIQVSVWRRTA